jgi:hypothetical protein
MKRPLATARREKEADLDCAAIADQSRVGDT